MKVISRDLWESIIAVSRTEKAWSLDDGGMSNPFRSGFVFWVNLSLNLTTDVKKKLKVKLAWDEFARRKNSTFNLWTREERIRRSSARRREKKKIRRSICGRRILRTSLRQELARFRVESRNEEAGNAHGVT